MPVSTPRKRSMKVGPSAPQWVDARTIGAIYGVTAFTIYRMAKDGQIPHLKVRGQYRFQVEAVDKALQGQSIREKTTEDAAA